MDEKCQWRFLEISFTQLTMHSTFIDIGNTGKGSEFRRVREDGLCNIQIKCHSWVDSAEHRRKTHVEKKKYLHIVSRLKVVKPNWGNAI